MNIKVVVRTEAPPESMLPTVKTDGGEHPWGNDLRYADGTDLSDRLHGERAGSEPGLLRRLERRPLSGGGDFRTGLYQRNGLAGRAIPNVKRVSPVTASWNSGCSMPTSAAFTSS